MVLDLLQSQKEILHAELTHVLRTYANEYANMPFGSEIELLIEQITAGKLIRGSTILTLTKMREGDMGSAIRCAVAIELFHFALLVHDDIMDGDEKRRGYSTVHARLAKTHSTKSAESLAICMGDIFLFLGMQQLNEVCNQNARRAMLECLTQTGFGQMSDVDLADKAKLDKSDIIKMYGLKTAAYTFVLPFLVAAQISKPFEFDYTEYAMKLGVLFQIQDDRLGLFGDTKKTGKAVGADIRERKSTIYRALLDENASADDLVQIELIYHSQEITDAQVEQILAFISQYGIDDKVKELEETYESKIRLICGRIPDDTMKLFTIGLLEFIMSRAS